MFELFFKYPQSSFEQGELIIASGWPLWPFGVLLLLSFAVVAIGLRRGGQGVGIARLAVIGSIQLLLLGGILALLWRPALSVQTLRPQENSVAVLLDTSASMSYGAGDRSRLQESIAALRDRVLPDLESDFAVEYYAFAERLLPLSSLERVPAPGATTGIGQALLDVLRGASAGALGAVVLVSDGNDNSGELDAARLAEIASFGVPIHVLGVGREVIPEDIELADVVVSPQGLPGSTVSAQVSVRHAAAALAQLKVYDGDAILESEVIELPDRSGVTTRWIDIDVGEAGVRDLRFSLDALAGERDVVNNTQWRPMEVTGRRRHVLYVEGEPRWEYKFMRRAIGDDSPTRLVSLLRTTPNKFYRQGVDSAEELIDGFPDEERELFAYDALIIGSFESASLSEQQQMMIVDFVGRRGGSLLMLGGRRGLADGGWGATPVADVLPARLPEIDAPSFLRFPVKASLSEAGRLSLLTRFDSNPDTNVLRWEEMPEIGDFQYLAGLKPGAEVLLEANVQGQREPLLAQQRFGLGNAYILATGGTWRWQMQLPHEDQRHETFWRQLLQTMASSAPESVQLTTEAVFYGDRSEIELIAEIRDRDFEPTDEASVSVAVTSVDQLPVDVPMTPIAGETGRYRAVYQAAEPGIYRFEASAELGGESLGSSRLAVRRDDGVAEHFRIGQNRSLLERLADASGGRYFSLDDGARLPEAVQFSEAGIVERQILDLWNMPIVFLVLMLLKAGEWLLRLYWGRL